MKIFSLSVSKLKQYGHKGLSVLFKVLEMDEIPRPELPHSHVLRPVKQWKANCILPYGRVLDRSSVGAQETILSAFQNGSLVLFNSLNH